MKDDLLTLLIYKNHLLFSFFLIGFRSVGNTAVYVHVTYIIQIDFLYNLEGLVSDDDKLEPLNGSNRQLRF